MSDIAIKVEGLGKRYKIGKLQRRHDTLRDRIADARVFNLFKRRNGNNGDSQFAIRNSQSETLWALKDVSFEVKRGEVVGVIGRNGAGKSTLLKILSRITEPTEGYADINGRVASLLEVGTGFHPELTGRENIYLNGSILGMKRVEINNKFDEIVAFAEVEKFIDTPVKYYSSGMYVRLAFAVAAHLEPEILLVDEVLAVGDAAFQEKCLGKLGNVAKEGRTVLFVSHNMQAVNTICKRAIALDQGRIADNDYTAIVVNKYLQRIITAEFDSLKNQGNRLEGGGIRLHDVRVAVSEGKLRDVITMDESFNIDIEYSNLLPGRPLLVTVILYSLDGAEVFESDTSNDLNWHGKIFPAGRCKSSCAIIGDLLNEGRFRIRVLFHNLDTMKTLLDCKEALVVSIHDTDERKYSWFGHFKGFVHPKLEWNTQSLCNFAHLQSSTSKSDLTEVQ